MISQAVENFVSFPPLGLIITVMLVVAGALHHLDSLSGCGVQSSGTYGSPRRHRCLRLGIGRI